MKISIIAAVSKNNVIGKKGSGLLWHLPMDLKHFKEITLGHHMLMGRKTFETIGKALPGRTNIVLSSDASIKAPDIYVFKTIDEAIEFAEKRNETELMIIGGGKIYEQFLPIADKLYITEVKKRFGGDVVFPEINKNEWKEVSREKHKDGDIAFNFVVFERI